MNKLARQIEAVLYYSGGSIKKKEFVKLLNTDLDKVEKAIKEIQELRSDSGIVLLDLGDTISLSASSDSKEAVENYTKKEMKGNIGRAGAEALSIIAYIGPVSRNVIEYIRGVHSQFIIQRLLLRGLIKKRGEGRSTEYLPTVELLASMGVKTKEELPEYEETKVKLLEVLKNRESRMKEQEV